MSNPPATLSLGVSSRFDDSGYGAALIALNDSILAWEGANDFDPKYVVVVLARSDASVAFNKTYGKDVDSHIMADMQPFIDKEGQYILVMATKCMHFGYLPTGPFYQFLMDCGATEGLRTLETLAGNAASQLYIQMQYIIVGIIDKDPGTAAVEAYRAGTDAFELTKSLCLEPIQVGEAYLYSIVDKIIKGD